MGVPSKFSLTRFSTMLILLTLLFTLPLLSQTVIKEKVKIKPEEKKTQLNKTSNTDPYKLWVQISGQSDWSAILEGPCGVGGSSSGTGGSIKYISINNPPVGKYNIQLTQYFPNYGGMPTQIGYIAGYSGFYEGTDSTSFSYQSIYQGANGSHTSTLSFDLNYINDFEIEAIGGFFTTCGETNSIVRIKGFEQVSDCSKYIPLNLYSNTMMNLTIESQTEDLVFRDVRNYISLGRSITIPINQGYVGLMLKESFRGIPETATVTAEINGVTRTASVFVNTYPPYDPAISTFYNNVFLFHGTSYKNTIVMDYDICTEIEPPESIKFNLEIQEGSQFGHLIDPVTGAGTNSLTNLTNQEGKREFEFVADGIASVDDGTVVIKVTASDSRIEPCYVTYSIKSNKIKVVFEPKSIMPGDTADVILKKIEPDGSLVDFEEDQRFDLKLIAGSEYGDIYIPQWEEITDESWYVEQGFKFIASTEIDSLQVESVLKVNTSGGLAGSRLPGNESNEEEYRKISKSTGSKNFEAQKRNISEQHKSIVGDVSKSVMIGGEDEILWGIGKILIGNSNDCSDAPRCDEESKPPIIDIRQVNSDPSLCLKKERRGAFQVPLGKPFRSVNLEACYNISKDQWQFKIVGDNTFYIDYYFEICIQNIIELYGKKAIFNIDELVSIPVDSVCNALKDFNDILYGGVKTRHYFIVETTIEEEEIHRSDFIMIKNNLFVKENFFEKFQEIHLKCKEFNSVETALIKGTKHYDYLFNLFRQKLKENWEARVGKINSLQRVFYEQEVNQKLSYLVLLYKEKLRQIYPNINCDQ